MQSRVKAYEGQTELLEGLFAVGCAWDTNPLPFAEALKITADISHMGKRQRRPSPPAAVPRTPLPIRRGNRSRLPAEMGHALRL